MGYFKNTTVWWGHNAPLPSNFVVSCSIMIKFGGVLKFDDFSQILPKTFLKNDVNATISFEASKFYISGPIWLKVSSGIKFQVLILNLKWYFTLEANIKPILAISCNFASEKSDKHSLTIGLLWQQFKSQINKTYTFWCSIHRLL